jgi:F0F1-type ATP synthase assembly protein I
MPLTRRIVTAAVASLVLAVCLIPAFTQGSLGQALSPIDEGAHIDYSIHLANGSPPSWDSHLTLSTRRIIACAGKDSSSTACEVRVLPVHQYSAYGYSYETQQPPLGYLPYAFAWKLLHLSADTPQRALRDLRLVNIFWAACDVIFFGLVVFALNFALEVSIAGALFLGLNPQTTALLTYVTNDAPAVAVGLASVLMMLWLLSDDRRREHTRPIYIYLLFGMWGAIVALCKTTFLIVPLVFVVVMLIYRKRLPRAKEAIVATSIQFVTAVAATFMYQGWNNLRSATSSKTVEHALLSFSTVSHFPVVTIEQSIGLSTSLFVTGSQWSLILFLLLSLGLVITNLIRPIELVSEPSILFRTTGTAILAGIGLAVGQTVFLYELGHYNFYSPVRYLSPLLPILMIPAIAQLRMSRRFNWLYLSLGAISLYVVLK